ncbi:MAG: inorganic diphosphatase [Candidatus Micrarchaeota archaeon]
MGCAGDIKTGNPPKEVNAVIEVPKGSSNKYEYDAKENCFKLDRALHSAVFFPFDYGFIPGTKSIDGDALDIMVLTEQPTFTGCVIKSRVIGLFEMEDESGTDYKIVAVPASDVEPRLKEIKTVNDLQSHRKKEIEDFMSHYKSLEPKKWVRIVGFKGIDKAYKIIKKSLVSGKQRKR